MSNPWVLIPARSGSKGIPNKNVQLVGGVPLFLRTIRHALTLDPSITIVVSTDSLEYLAMANGEPLSGEFVEHIKMTGIAKTPRLLLHLRPESMGRDDSLIMDLVAELAFHTPALKEFHLGTCLLLQPTSPFRADEEMKDFEAKLLFSTEDSSVVSVVDTVDDHPARMYLPSLEGGTTYGRPLSDYRDCQFLPRQNLPKTYIRDGGFYIIGRNLIIKREQVGSKPELYVRQYPHAINIDSQFDLELANLSISREASLR